MKKALLLLLPISLAALTGCNKDGGKTSEEEVKEVVVDASVILANASFESDTKQYPSAAYSFEISGVTFNATSDTGVARPYTGEQNGYSELGAMQFKKQGAGMIQGVLGDFAATKIVVNWVNTRSSQAANYLPQVSAGPAGAVVALTQKEAIPATGTKTDKKQTSGDNVYDVYSYVSTFELAAGTTNFSIASGDGAFYPTSIVISK